MISLKISPKKGILIDNKQLLIGESIEKHLWLINLSTTYDDSTYYIDTPSLTLEYNDEELVFLEVNYGNKLYFEDVNLFELGESLENFKKLFRDRGYSMFESEPDMINIPDLNLLTYSENGTRVDAISISKPGYYD